MKDVSQFPTMSDWKDVFWDVGAKKLFLFSTYLDHKDDHEIFVEVRGLMCQYLWTCFL